MERSAGVCLTSAAGCVLHSVERGCRGDAFGVLSGRCPLSPPPWVGAAGKMSGTFVSTGVALLYGMAVLVLLALCLLCESASDDDLQ